jgi:hypothetical protein
MADHSSTDVVQVAKPAIGFFDRPTVQFGLHPPYCEVRRIRVRPYRRGADIHRRVFGHCFLSLTDTLPPFPGYVALPRSEYYDGSAPPTPSAGIAPIHATPWPRTATGNIRGRFPRLLASDQRIRHPAVPLRPAASPRLRRSHSPWPPDPGVKDPARSFPHSPLLTSGVRAAIQPISTGFELTENQEA